MMDNIRVNIFDQEYDVLQGTTFEELSKSFQKYYKYPIILAKVNGRIKELHHKVKRAGTIEFLDLTSREGNRAHVNSLIFVMVYAIKSLYGYDKDIVVQHSIDKGVYIETTFLLDEEKIVQIKNKMLELIESDLHITKIFADRVETSDYFKSIGYDVKAEVMKYITDSHITLYRLGDLYNYFYGPMVKSIKALKDFDLTYIGEEGFVLRFPTVYIHDHIKEYQHHSNMFEVFQTSREWAKIMNIKNSADLNRMISSGHINDLIRINETLHSNELLKVAGDIHKRTNSIKIILLAGPSSSGKTTSTRKLCMYLKSYGVNTKIISMDDYFVDREQTPLDENGDVDYESLEAMDLPLFDKQIAELLNGIEVITPIYNFKTGKKEFKQQMKLEKDELLFIEGIHALDDKILKNIGRDKKYKIYISALTELNIDNHNRISTTDNRLLRRIIRDNRTRGHKVENTLERWPSVRKGEELYIFPFQDEADYTINSALIYEIGVLKTYVEPLLYSVDYNSPYYEEAKRLINFLRIFLPIPSDAIPQDSVLREFIGGSCFHE